MNAPDTFSRRGTGPGTSRLTISLPQPSPLAAELSREEEDDEEEVGGLSSGSHNGSSTAPIMMHALAGTEPRPRHFSFGHGYYGGRGHPVRVSSRQKTISGDSTASLFSRAISRTFTFTSNASSSIPTDEWRKIFDKFDVESDGIRDGKIPVVRFKEILEDDPLWVSSVPPDVQQTILNNVDRNGDNVIDFEEFICLVQAKQLPGFGKRRRQALRELLKQTVDFIVPYKYLYQNQYSCWPPPLFMVLVSLLQLAIFTYNCFALNEPPTRPVRQDCSHLIFDPELRHQVWRYLTYMFIHSGLFHITFNVLVQLVLGIPLEMVHGWWRVMLVYMSGVLAGSLWTSVFRPDVSLSGASGGVYALITAHLGTVIMNFREMTCPWCRVFVVTMVAITDAAVFVYEHYSGRNPDQLPVSYPAHISGAMSGLLVGIMCLKNLRWERHERYIWAVSTMIFVLLIGSAIVFSVAHPSYFESARRNWTHLFPEDTMWLNCSASPIFIL